MDKINCLQKEAGAKKLFATTTPKKIVCLDEMSIPPPPLQKNNGPSLSIQFVQTVAVGLVRVEQAQYRDGCWLTDASWLTNDGS